MTLIKKQIFRFYVQELNKDYVLVKIKYTSLNYKDGLAILNKAPIIKKYPMIPGSDFAGIVIKSNHKRFKKGDKVVCNGWGIGEKHYGGFSEYARVNGDWLIHFPKKYIFLKHTKDDQSRFFFPSAQTHRI